MYELAWRPSCLQLTDGVSCVHTDNSIGIQGAVALAPELGKLVNLTDLDLRGTCFCVQCCMLCVVRTCTSLPGAPRAWQLTDGVSCVHTDNKIGIQGAVALAPELGKLVSLTKLYLRGPCFCV